MAYSSYLFGSEGKPLKLKTLFALPPDHCRLLPLVRSSESSSVQSKLKVEPNTIMSSGIFKETTSREQ